VSRCEGQRDGAATAAAAEASRVTWMTLALREASPAAKSEPP